MDVLAILTEDSFSVTLVNKPRVRQEGEESAGQRVRPKGNRGHAGAGRKGAWGDGGVVSEADKGEEELGLPVMDRRLSQSGIE